jgi:hypothetical protein
MKRPIASPVFNPLPQAHMLRLDGLTMDCDQRVYVDGTEEDGI